MVIGTIQSHRKTMFVDQVIRDRALTLGVDLGVGVRAVTFGDDGDDDREITKLVGVHVGWTF